METEDILTDAPETLEQETAVDTAPNIDGVEIVSNGNEVDTKTPSEDDEAADTETEATPQEEEVKPEEDLQTKIDEQVKADEDAKTLLTEKGVNYEKLQESYQANGSLTEEQYKELTDAGFPKSVVDAYISGVEAQADRFVNTVQTFAGGKEAFDSMTKFVASQGQSKVDAFNSIMDTANLETIQMFVDGIKANMAATYGTKNPSILGSGATKAAAGFADQGEMITAMSDIRYGRDAKYTRSVEQKLAVSTFM